MTSKTPDHKDEKTDQHQPPPAETHHKPHHEQHKLPAAEAAPSPAAAPDDSMAKVKQMEEEVAGYRDKYLRLAAEFDNYKKRMSRQFESVVKGANDELILQIVPILDNFERALEAAKTSEDFNSFHQGVELIKKQLGDILQKAGVREIATVGQAFDPRVHEAVQTVADKTQPPHVVVQEVQKGYTVYDRVVRAAKVVVNQLAENREPKTEN